MKPITLLARYRRALRRAAKVSIGALAGALACVVVAVGGVDGAAVLGGRIPLPQAIATTATLALVAIAVIRRLQFAAPTARAQRVSMWLAAAEDLADPALDTPAEIETMAFAPARTHSLHEPPF